MRHYVYTISVRETGFVLYVGLTANFESRTRQHLFSRSILKRNKARLIFEIFCDYPDRGSGRVAETTLASKLKKRGQCPLNLRPSCMLSLIPKEFRSGVWPLVAKTPEMNKRRAIAERIVKSLL